MWSSPAWGHQSIQTTVDVYGHVISEADIAAGEAFERAVASAALWGTMVCDG